MPDHRAADLDRHVHDLADLLGEDLRQRPAEDREVLTEDAHGAAEDRPVTRHDRISPRPLILHPELALPMPDEPVELDERAGVEKQLESLAGEELSALVLARNRRLGAGVRRLVAQLAEPGELRLGGLVAGRHRHVSLIGSRRGPAAPEELPSGRRSRQRGGGPNNPARPLPRRDGSGLRFAGTLTADRPPRSASGSSSKRGMTCKCA